MKHAGQRPSLAVPIAMHTLAIMFRSALSAAEKCSVLVASLLPQGILIAPHGHTWDQG